MLLDWLARMPAAVDAEEGKVNIWACDTCGRPTVARDIHVGTTPMRFQCRANADQYDDTGMARPTAYEAAPELVATLGTLDDDDLVHLAKTRPAQESDLFMALAYADPDRSKTVQDRLPEALSNAELTSFAVELLHAQAQAADDRCPGTAHSTFYTLPPADSTPWAIVELLDNPPWEWVRPTTVDELRGLDNEMLHHLVRGGLLLRKRAGATGCAPSPTDLADDDAEQRSRFKRFFDGLAKRTP